MLHMVITRCRNRQNGPWQDMTRQDFMKGWEKFNVVDAGAGEVAFHNKYHNRFIRLGNKHLDRNGSINSLPEITSGENLLATKQHFYFFPCSPPTCERGELLPFWRTPVERKQQNRCLAVGLGSVSRLSRRGSNNM